MTPEIKEKARTLVQSYYEKVFPNYPATNSGDPREALQHLPKIYKVLVKEKIITIQSHPYPIFEAFMLDIFQGKIIEQALMDF